MRTRSARNAEPARGAKRTTGLQALPDELLARILVHLPSIRDFGRANCVCRAWHARASPVEQALRERIEARGDAILAPSAGCTTSRMCWLELLRQTRTASGRISANERMGAAVDERGALRVWAKQDKVEDDEGILHFRKPTVLPALAQMRVECISIAHCHMLLLTDTGEVLSSGSGGEGRLGHGDEEDQPVAVPKVQEALPGVRLVAIATGYGHSMVLTDEGEVFSFGEGGCGQLGHGDDEDELVPQVIEELRGTRVVAVATGYGHSMVLTDEGEVLSFGAGEFGRLGHGDEQIQRVPKAIAGRQAFRM